RRVVFFFFSSRRRHTRSLRDWSSDVCSSDLGTPRAAAGARSAAMLPEAGTKPMAVIADISSSTWASVSGVLGTVESPQAPTNAAQATIATDRNRLVMTWVPGFGELGKDKARDLRRPRASKGS